MHRWLPLSLLLAGLHSIVWGCAIILLPGPAARVYGLAETPHDLFLWQGTGLVIVLFGAGYLIAATNPGRHWAVVFLGLAAKVLGPIGMLFAVFRSEISSDVLWLLPANDIVVVVAVLAHCPTWNPHGSQRRQRVLKRSLFEGCRVASLGSVIVEHVHSTAAVVGASTQALA